MGLIVIEESSMNSNDLEPILIAFQNMRSNDNTTMKAAEANLLEFMRHPVCISSFLYILLNCDDPVVRTGRGVM